MTNSPINRHLYEPFLERLRELGYVDDRNLVIEYRDAEGQLDQLPGLAAELARRDLDVIISSSSCGVRAAHLATSTMPIVSPLICDPVDDGFAISLAGPGGNITGLTTFGPGSVLKRPVAWAAYRRFITRRARAGQISVALYKMLEAEAGQSVGFKQVSNIPIARTPHRWDEYMYYKGVADTIGIRVNVLTPAQLKDIWPLRETDGVIGAIRYPDDGIKAMTALSVDPDNARLKG